MKKPLTIVPAVLIILTVIGGIYYYIKAPNRTNKETIKIDLSTVECSRVQNNIKNCPEDYFCNESILGGLGIDERGRYIASTGHEGGDNKCYKLCKSNNDCPGDNPYCTKMEVSLGDYSETKLVCQKKESCAAQGESFYTNTSPLYCCKGLDNVLNYEISIAGKCYIFIKNTSYGNTAGICSNCGDSICQSGENVCSCPVDCVGRKEPEYKTVQDFCAKYWNTTDKSIQDPCMKDAAFIGNPICDLCPLTP